MREFVVIRLVAPQNKISVPEVRCFLEDSDGKRLCDFGRVTFYRMEDVERLWTMLFGVLWKKTRDGKRVGLRMSFDVFDSGHLPAMVETVARIVADEMDVIFDDGNSIVPLAEQLGLPGIENR